MSQPTDIINDVEKALKLYDEDNFDRFDELCTVEWWVQAARIQHEELKTLHRKLRFSQARR